MYQFKIGDRVKIKTWERMKKEHGLDKDGDINTDPPFTRRMAHLCGAEATITHIDGINVDLTDFSNQTDDYFCFSTQMIEPAILYKVTDSNLFVEEEIHTNCTVQILRNVATGELSVGWWENEK